MLCAFTTPDLILARLDLVNSVSVETFATRVVVMVMVTSVANIGKGAQRLVFKAHKTTMQGISVGGNSGELQFGGLLFS